jgi:hypothetical protein
MRMEAGTMVVTSPRDSDRGSDTWGLFPLVSVQLFKLLNDQPINGLNR